MKKIILLLLIMLPVIALAQKTRVVKGKVVGESDGLPLPGASVYIDKNIIGEKTELEGVIKNFSLGTTTDINGEFSFTLPEKVDFLLCSFIGFETQKVSIKGKGYFVIKLKDENKVLNEVVVTGYQKIEKRKVTSSVIKVKTDAIMQADVRWSACRSTDYCDKRCTWCSCQDPYQGYGFFKRFSGSSLGA